MQNQDSQKILIGTGNVSKLAYLRQLFAGTGIECISPVDIGLGGFDAPEDRRTAEDNAIEKALAWYAAARIPVLTLDAGLLFLDLPDDHPDQPGVHVRRAPGHTMEDEEMLDYFAKLVHRNGGRLRAAWQDSYCMLKDPYNYRSFTFTRDMLVANSFLMVDTPCDTRIPGWPINSISIDPATGKYQPEMTHADRRAAQAHRAKLTADSQSPAQKLAAWIKKTSAELFGDKIKNDI